MPRKQSKRRRGQHTEKKQEVEASRRKRNVAAVVVQCSTKEDELEVKFMPATRSILDKVL